MKKLFEDPYFLEGFIYVLPLYIFSLVFIGLMFFFLFFGGVQGCPE